MKLTRPTCEFLITELLRNDTLVPITVIKAKFPDRHVWSAIINLRRYKAIDAILVDGVPCFFLTPDTDDRIRTYEERAPETRPRKRKWKEAKKT